MKNLISIILILTSFNSFSQKEYIVTAKSGLSIRNKPSIKGLKTGKLNFREKIYVIETTDFSFTTEKIKGYWIKIKTIDNKQGYVFNGFIKPFTQNKINYSLKRNGEDIYEELNATVNDEKINIISFKDRKCFEIIEIQDYNNDGLEEVLIETNACGGNCCGNTIFVISYKGDKFIQTQQVGYDFDGIELNYNKNNTRHFIIDNQNIGAGNTSLCEDEKETYIFENYELKLINVEHQQKLEAILELKSEDFLPKESDLTHTYDKTLHIEYDIDNNGIMDKISAGYWERWGILSAPEIILNNKELKCDVLGSPKRIGILKTKTNNVNDLVIECDKILKWNGYAYE